MQYLQNLGFRMEKNTEGRNNKKNTEMKNSNLPRNHTIQPLAKSIQIFKTNYS